MKLNIKICEVYYVAAILYDRIYHNCEFLAVLSEAGQHTATCMAN
jgi:hypothetical protein